MPIKTNQFKEVSKKKETVKTETSKKAKYSDGLKRFVFNPKLKLSLGIFLFFVSIFLLLAFSSYYLTWSADDSKISGDFWDQIFTKSQNPTTGNAYDVKNWMGRVGVFAASFFIKEWFGIAAFLLPVFFIYLMFILVFQIKRIPVYQALIYFILGTIWISTSFGYFFTHSENGLLSGKFGYICNQELDILLGKPGTGLLLLLILIIFLIINVKIPDAWLSKKEKTTTLLEPELLNLKKKTTSESAINSINQIEDDAYKYNTVEFSVADLEESEVPSGESDFTQENHLSGTHLTSKGNGNVETNDEVELLITNLNQEPLKINHKKEPQPEIYGTGIDTEFDPRLELSDYRFPGLDLLEDYGNDTISIQPEEIEMNKRRIVQTLNNYDIEIQKIKATVGPTVTLYEIIPAPGVRINKIKSLEYDIALSLAALGIRIIAPIPGKGTIGIEVPNLKPEIVSMKSILASEKFQSTKFGLPFGIGKTIANESYIADLTKMPHILMAGATGQGKSVGLNAIIASILYKKHPAEVKFVMVDPKKVELTLFTKIERHFLAKLPDSEEAIITDTRKVVRTLNSLCIEMDNRYELLKDAQVRNIGEYNVKFISRKLSPLHGHRFLPFLILVIDEFADLIMTAGKEIEVPLTRLAQLARAVGIHLIIATQRPSVNIITGSIKANFPARIAFRVISKIDSRTILDQGGADQLVGRGDMLFSTGSDLIRLQCAFIDTHEIEKLTDFIGSQRAFPDAYHLPEYYDEQDEPITEFNPDERDELFEEAARLLVATQQGSTSLLQRKLKLGYNRAGRIIDQLEAAGIVGPFEGSKAREVKIANEVALEQFLKDINDKTNSKK